MHISSQLAEFIYSISNVILVVGAILVATGTIAAIWSGGIIDLYNSERISRNEAETEIARADAAKANADAAMANENAAKVGERAATLKREAAILRLTVEQERIQRLRLEQRVAWRALRPEQKHALIEALSGNSFKVWVTTVGSDPEAVLFHKDICGALSEAGLEVKCFTGYAMRWG